MSLVIWSIFQLVVYFHKKKKNQTKKNPSLNLVIVHLYLKWEQEKEQGFVF